MIQPYIILARNRAARPSLPLALLLVLTMLLAGLPAAWYAPAPRTAPAGPPAQPAAPAPPAASPAATAPMPDAASPYVADRVHLSSVSVRASAG